ncbi:MAG TPA: hypothetical protein PLV92_08965 [Pirellulaceae bacterium]|nr:hypothetical protein [Pirellulaceae bacterium]
MFETASQTIRELAATGTFTSEQLLDDGALHSRFAQVAMDAGQVTVAARDLAQARSAFEAVAKSDPHKRPAMRGLAVVFGKQAELAQTQGRKSEAKSNALRALELREKLSDGAPDDREDLASLGLAQYRVAEILHLQGETDNALVHVLGARRTYKRLGEGQSVDHQTRLNALRAEGTLGDLLAASGEFDEAETVLTRCLDQLSKLMAQFPEQAHPKFLSSVTASDLANLKLKKKEIPSATGYANRAASIADELVTISPDNFRYQVQLISALLIASDAARDAGDLESATARAARAVAISESAARIDAGHDELQRLLASSYLRHAKLLAKVGDRDGALRDTRLSVAIRERRATERPSDWSRVRELRLGNHDLARNLASEKRHDEAREAWRRATEALDRLIAHRVATDTDWSNLRADTTGLAIAAAEAGRTVEAVAARERLIEIAKYFVEREATDASLADLRHALLVAGRMLRDNGQPARAERFFIEALAVVGRLAALPGQEQASRIARVELLIELGRCDFGHYDLESARHWFEFARAELSTAAADQATRDRLTKAIAQHLKDCVDVTQGLADPSVAEKVFKEARVSQDRSLAMLARVANAARRGDFATARATAERLAVLAEQGDSSLWFQAARAHALCVAARDAKRSQNAAVASIANANIETETGTETQAENVTKANSHAGADADSDADAKRACELLVSARTASLFRNGVRYARLQSHEDLNSLRQRREFQQFLCETDPDFSPAPTTAPISR